MATPTISALGQFGVADSGADSSAITDRFQHVGSTFGQKTEIYHSNVAARGTRSRRKERNRIVTQTPTGTVTMEPTATEIDWFIEKILGGTTDPTSQITLVANALPEFVMSFDRTTERFFYTGCRVARCVISGSQGQALQWALDIEAETETKEAVAFATLSIPTDNIFIMGDVTLTLNSVAQTIESFSLTIDNVLRADRFMDAVSRAEIPALDRIVTMEVMTPYDSVSNAVHDIGIAGVAGSLAIADGTDTYTFDFANVKNATEHPGDTPGTENMMPLHLQMFADASNDEIKYPATP
jgi:hypothetical protein